MGTVSSARSILLVDDSPIVRAVVKHALSAAGFDVASVDDPRHLAGALAERAPDLVLVDATFPGVSDEQLVALVAPHAEAFALILFSDRPEGDVRDLVARIGARGFVPKDGATLADRLAAWLDA